MSDQETVTTDERKVTWGLSRKLTDGNYGSVEASIYMTDHLPAESSVTVPEFVEANSEAAFDTLKTQVWDVLGMEFEFNEMGRPSLVKKAPPPAPAAPAAVPQATPAAPLASAPGIPLTAHAEKPAFCKECAGVEFWDNRADQDKKMQQGNKIGPDWACKNPDCKKGVFRDGSYDYNQAVGQGPAPTAPPAPLASNTEQQLTEQLEAPF